MLSRTASNLYWMARYVERAENTARILDVAYRMSLMSQASEMLESEWLAPLNISGTLYPFDGRYSTVTARDVMMYMALDPDNAGSIVSCAKAARENARAVRGNITSEMWEVLNSTWLEFQHLTEDRLSGDGALTFFDWVKERSHLFRGVTVGTALKDGAFHFNRLGTFLERADNTTRILDVKYHVLLPETEKVGGSLDYFQWTAILRAVSAHTSYHWVYRQGIKPWLVADLLILRPEMPRSLTSCYENIVRHLDSLGLSHGRQGASQRHARAMLGRLENEKIETIFQSGLHEFITAFIGDNTRLGSAIAEQYLT
jgi:uncharacterized alpha-E superfamily protein